MLNPEPVYGRREAAHFVAGPIGGCSGRRRQRDEAAAFVVLRRFHVGCGEADAAADGAATGHASPLHDQGRNWSLSFRSAPLPYSDFYFTLYNKFLLKG